MRRCAAAARATLAAGLLCAAHAHAQGTTATVVEYYHAGFDHYFVTPLAHEIDALDSGAVRGWARTGLAFGAWAREGDAGSAGASPVCRFYLPPAKGDSHFFSASPDECADVLRKIVTDPNYEGYVDETRSAFFVALPDPRTGACPAGTQSVYRVWNGRADSNHRYTTDRVVREALLQRGWIAEGYGPESVAMCAPPLASATTSVVVSGPTPYAAGCSTSIGTVYANAEVEPQVAVDPRDPNHLIGVWQQDRWSNGSARGLMTGVSFDGGRTWERHAVPFTRCAGGNAANGGDYDRATDPWVTIAPDGTAWQAALAASGGTFAPGSVNAITVSRSTDGGRTWSDPRALIVDGAEFFNDKEAITADPFDARRVYVAWDRLARSGGGPSYFTRTTDGGATWEPPRAVYDPGGESQTINNVPVVASDGTLLLFFTQLDATASGNAAALRVMRSPDHGTTWDVPVDIARILSVGTRDPQTGTAVRDAAILPSVAAGPNGQLAAVWQDARFAGGQRDGIAISRSLDGGRTWSEPARLNADPAVQAFVPTVAIRGDGTIAVTYFDFRSDTASAATLLTDYWIATSADGVLWREQRLAGPFDLALAPNAGGLFLGDYMGLGVAGQVFVPLFVTTEGGSTANRTEVRAAVVAGLVADAPARIEAPAPGARPGTYRAARGATEFADAASLAAAIDANIMNVMSRRMPGWRSPRRPTR